MDAARACARWRRTDRATGRGTRAACAARDGAYHQGTVWPWLLGAFVEAWVRVRGDTRGRARRGPVGGSSRRCSSISASAGLGHISEIADADPPHTPRGCPFQAWSVGELLRLDRQVLGAAAKSQRPGGSVPQPVEWLSGRRRPGALRPPIMPPARIPDGGALLGLFMISACTFTVLLYHPAAPVRGAIPDPFARRLLMGLAMGATAILLIYSPWGKQSGAHMNPAITLTFTRLGKVAPRDALGYMAAQFAGGVARRARRADGAGRAAGRSHRGYAATLPGRWGARRVRWRRPDLLPADAVVLSVSQPSAPGRCTPALCAGLLVATYITVEAPLSGMSMNPARTFGSAFCGRRLDRALDLLHRAAAGHAGGGQLHLARHGRPARLRQAASPEREALHLLRVPAAAGTIRGPRHYSPHRCRAPFAFGHWSRRSKDETA